MTLFAHVDLVALTSVVHEHHDEPIVVEGAISAAGNWGYTSPDGRRFALTGTSAGLSIVEVTDPRRPRPVALVPGPASQWREVRTYGTYAYVSTEAQHGIDIVDLSDPDHPRKVQTWSKTVASAHTLTVDTERGLLYVNGANGRTGGMHVLDVGADPEDPAEVGAFHGYYVHDAYARGDVLFVSAMYDGFQALLDVSDPARIREITRFFTGGRFPHNSWLTRDARYLFTTDERADSPLEGWDLVDPFAPRKVSQYIAAPGTIPHNVMIDGDRMVVSHYTEGVHLLDVRDPERPRLLGSYDTYTGAATGFSGAWGGYIFPATDLIVVSDINGGLFVVGYTPQ
jgi:choice-of-anchor B domain-containing protein